MAWRYELLYVPFLFPFVLASTITVIIWRKHLPDGVSVAHPFMEAAHRCVVRTPGACEGHGPGWMLMWSSTSAHLCSRPVHNPCGGALLHGGRCAQSQVAHCVPRRRRVARIVPAILGSLVLVSLLRKAEAPGARPAYILGANLSDFMKEGFVAISALLGGLGSFFSGSTIVSNLTFGLVQLVRTCPVPNVEVATLNARGHVSRAHLGIIALFLCRGSLWQRIVVSTHAAPVAAETFDVRKCGRGRVQL